MTYLWKLLYELQSTFLTELNGHGFLLRDYVWDYTELQDGPLRPLLRPRSLNKEKILTVAARTLKP